MVNALSYQRIPHVEWPMTTSKIHVVDAFECLKLFVNPGRFPQIRFKAHFCFPDEADFEVIVVDNLLDDVLKKTDIHIPSLYLGYLVNLTVVEYLSSAFQNDGANVTCRFYGNSKNDCVYRRVCRS